MPIPLWDNARSWIGRNGSVKSNKQGKGGIALADVQSEPTPTEEGKPLPAAPTYGEEADLCQLVWSRARSAEMQRRVAVREWVLGVAFYEGRQWLGWDDTLWRAKSLMVDDEVNKYVTRNLCQPTIDRMIGLANQNKPDANTAPFSDSEIDRAAAAEGRAITAHLARRNGQPMQMLDVLYWATICGLVYYKQHWDPNCMADVAVPGPNGQTAKKISARIGDVEGEVLPPWTILVDPRAKRWDKAKWIIEDVMMDLGDIQDDYGVRVEPDSGAAGSWFDMYMPDGGAYGGISSLGPFARESDTSRMARVACMYEKPTTKYPEGRMVCCTRDRLLYAGPMPLKNKDVFPFARLVYREAAAHPYGTCVMTQLIPVQIAVNRLLTKGTNHIESSKDTYLDPSGSFIGADVLVDDVEETRSFRRVKWNAQNSGGVSPTWVPALSMSADIPAWIDMAKLDMQEIAGIKEVDRGQVPGAVSSGVAIQLLQEQSNTRIGLFTSRIEQFCVDRDQLGIELYAQFAAKNLPRMMGLDDTGNPQQAQTQIQAFNALTDGGACAVYVVPGSAIPKSAAGKKQEVFELYKSGMLNPTVPGGETAISLMSDADSDPIIQKIRAEREQIAAAMAQQQANAPQKPDPAQVQQLKEQGATQRVQMQQQGENARLQMQHQADQIGIAAKFNAEVQSAQAQNAAKLQQDQHKAQLDMAVDENQAILDARVKTVGAVVAHHATKDQQLHAAALQVHVAKAMPKDKTPPKKARSK